MSKHYDNIEDARGKLMGTIVYYEKTPVVVKNVTFKDDDPNSGNFEVTITKSLSGRGHDNKDLMDPNFNFTRFNLGYANYDIGACWWYRMPIKQYQQGLKSSQLNYRATSAYNEYIFRASMPINNMLIDEYPSFDKVEEIVKDSNNQLPMAFSKDFAMAYDKIHRDLILEYKGRLIGCLTGSKDIKLMDEYTHLYEAVKEAVNV